MDWTALILGISTAILGGGNIAQFVGYKQLKRKMEAESDQEETKSLRLIIDGNVAEIQRLQARVDDYAKRYEDLFEQNLQLLARISELEKRLPNDCKKTK